MLGLLCRAVKGKRKVVLTGQGADEPLGGYPRHVAARLYPLARAFGPLLHALPERWLSSDRVARLRRIADTPEEARRFVETLAVFSPAEAVALTGHRSQLAALADPVRKWLPTRNGGDAVNRLLIVDARLSLADDLLIVADHTSMASGVELRVPFLDLEFLALIEHMPGRYKISRLGERKWLYRRGRRPTVTGAAASGVDRLARVGPVASSGSRRHSTAGSASGGIRKRRSSCSVVRRVAPHYLPGTAVAAAA